MGFSDLLTESPAFPFATTFRSGFSGSIEKGPFSTHRLLHVWVQILFFVETENLFFFASAALRILRQAMEEYKKLRAASDIRIHSC